MHRVAVVALDGVIAAAKGARVASIQRKPHTLLLHPWESVARRHVPNVPLPFLEDVILGAPLPE